MLFVVHGVDDIGCKSVKGIHCAMHFSESELMFGEFLVALKEKCQSAVYDFLHQFADTTRERDWAVILFLIWVLALFEE